MQKKRNAKMTAYAKTMDHEIADAEFSAVEMNPPSKDARAALEDLSVEELRVMVRATLGKSHAISVMRKEGLIEALVTGKLPTNEAAATKSIVQLPTQQADLANLLAQAVAQHLPKAGVNEEAVRAIVQAENKSTVEKMGKLAVETSALSQQVSKGLNALVDGLEDIRSKAINAVTRVLAEKMQPAFDDLEKKANDDRDRFVVAVRSEMNKTAKEYFDGALDHLADEITVKLQKKLVKEVTIKLPDGKKVAAGAQHAQFPRLTQLVTLGLNVMLVGPAASGKTRATEEAAKVLDLPFYPQSFNMQTPLSALFGYMDANGHYVPSVLRKAFEHGGLWLADEIDRASGNLLTALNAALENGYCSFPDKVVTRHPNFRCVASANTWGHGADRQYVGANQLDAATLNRFVNVPWNYDEALERLLAANNAWVDRVQAIRKVVFDDKIRLLVTPRASFFGARMLSAGIKQGEVEEMTIWNGCDKATKDKVLAKVPAQKTSVRVEFEGEDA